MYYGLQIINYLKTKDSPFFYKKILFNLKLRNTLMKNTYYFLRLINFIYKTESEEKLKKSSLC